MATFPAPTSCRSVTNLIRPLLIGRKTIRTDHTGTIGVTWDETLAAERSVVLKTAPGLLLSPDVILWEARYLASPSCVKITENLIRFFSIGVSYGQRPFTESFHRLFRHCLYECILRFQRVRRLRDSRERQFYQSLAGVIGQQSRGFVR